MTEDSLTSEDFRLLEVALKAKEKAYVIWGFKVGAAVLAEDGKIYEYEIKPDKKGKPKVKIEEASFSLYKLYQEDLNENQEPSLKKAMKKLNVKALYPFKEKPYKKVLKDLEKKKEKMKKKIEKFIKKKKIFKEKFIIYDFFAEDDKVFSQENFPSFGKVLTKDGKIYEFEFIPENFKIFLRELTLDEYVNYPKDALIEEIENLHKAMKKLKIKKLFPFQLYSQKEIKKILESRNLKARNIAKKLIKKKGIEKFELFDLNFSDQPGNIPICSGKLLTKEGKVFYFFTIWKPKEKEYSLKLQEIPQKDYLLYQEELDENEDTEFTKAAKKLGIKTLYPFKERKHLVLKKL